MRFRGRLRHNILIYAHRNVPLHFFKPCAFFSKLSAHADRNVRLAAVIAGALKGRCFDI